MRAFLAFAITLILAGCKLDFEELKDASATDGAASDARPVDARAGGS